MSTQKPDGWVIWSESGGCWAHIDAEGWDQLCFYPADVYGLKDLIGPKGVTLERGQRLRPVRLQFLDEMPEGEE